MKDYVILKAVCCAIFLAGQLTAFANTPLTSIDAKEAIRAQERQQQLREQQKHLVHPAPSSQPAASTLGKIPTDERPCVPIKHIRLEGEDAQQFQWLLTKVNVTETGEKDPAIPGCLGTKGINLIMQRLQQSLENRGLVTTKVLFPQHAFHDETLTLTIRPGRIARIRVLPSPSPLIRTRNAVPFNEGEIVDIGAIDQAIQNFNRLSSSHATINIVNSEAPNAPAGSSDILIKWKQTRPYRFSFGLDNSGSHATGVYQANATLSVDHLANTNDLFYISVNRDVGGGEPGSRGTQGGTIHYSVPWHYWLWGFTASTNTYYQTIASSITPYTYSGQSYNYEVKLSRLLYRDAKRETNATLALWHRRSQNFIEDVEIDIQRRRTAGWELGLSHRETINAATLDIELAYRQGTGIFDSLSAPEEAIGEGSSRPQILTARTHLSLPFTLAKQRFRYLNQIRAQWNGTRLIPQDRFAIGGRYTVRGFDGEAQLAGDRGTFVRNDLGLLLGEFGQEFYVGIDAGYVGGPSAATLVGKGLIGSALGVRGGYKAFSYDIFAGAPLYKPRDFTTGSPVLALSLNLNL